MFSFNLQEEQEEQFEENQQILNDLREIALLDRSEFGEYLQALIHIAGYVGCFGKAFERALAGEINTQYLYCKNHAKVVRSEVIRTVIERNLEWEF